MLEADLLAEGADMFAVFEASLAGAKPLTHSALLLYSETKLDAATGLLLGRAAAMIRATPRDCGILPQLRLPPHPIQL